jgi:hypothetical protein
MRKNGSSRNEQGLLFIKEKITALQRQQEELLITMAYRLIIFTRYQCPNVRITAYWQRKCNCLKQLLLF